MFLKETKSNLEHWFKNELIIVSWSKISVLSYRVYVTFINTKTWGRTKNIRTLLVTISGAAAVLGWSFSSCCVGFCNLFIDFVCPCLDLCVPRPVRTRPGFSSPSAFVYTEKAVRHLVNISILCVWSWQLICEQVCFLNTHTHSKSVKSCSPWMMHDATRGTSLTLSWHALEPNKLTEISPLNFCPTDDVRTL